MTKLDPATLESAARELMGSSKRMWASAKRNGRRGAYGAAHDDETWAQALRVWAIHFRGQAKAARKALTKPKR